MAVVALGSLCTGLQHLACSSSSPRLTSSAAPPSHIRSCASHEEGPSFGATRTQRRAVLQIPVIFGAILGIDPHDHLNAITVEESSLPVTKRVFFDITIDGQPAGQIVIGLFGDNVPIGAQRFFELSTGKRGIGYRKKEFYKIGRNYIQNVGVRAFSLTGGSEDAAKFTGGDTADQLIMEMKELERKGTRPKNKKWAVSLVAIDATKPPPKTRLVARDGAFVIVEEESRPDPNGTEFMILTADAPELDDTNTVVGEVIQGMDVVDRISNVKVVQENTSSPYFQVAKFIGDTRAVVAEKGFNRPYSKVLISKSGEIR
ncbi:unnamed protein product [Sphagnum jensenii]|uniref:PPIase cyclophilin-type domain-containing protein n=1 Tax=Sphagnum jensenii TaxID=128206 RepID=A0ABP0ZY97_9BRYO